MAKGVKTRNIDSFREGLMEYAYGRCSQAEAAKIAGMSVPTFRKYANMHFLGIPFPDTLFKAKEKREACVNFVKEENLWLLERRTIMDLQYNIRTKLLHLDTMFTELVATDWLKKSIIALCVAES